MTYFNVNNPAEKVSLKSAVLQSISTESGLYMPESIPLLPGSFFEKLHDLSLKEIALEVSKAMMGDDIPEMVLKQIVDEALDFEIPLKRLSGNLYVLELFHGPTLAFKDVGARFMAGLFNYFLQDDNREVTILVATSGDTGSAVANAFFNRKGVRVIILYPSGKVSDLQEKQLTTMGGNITAMEIDGNFDDCQRLVKQAFADKELNSRVNLTSANSINFARLFPQSFYYFHAFAQLRDFSKPVIFSIPSGNFGNLTAALIAKKMGLPVQKFIASTNINHVVPDYLRTGQYVPLQSHPTISNAMDVGNPSNFPRMLELYKNSHSALADDIRGFWYTDDQTRAALAEIQVLYGYQADPHGAIAYSGLRDFGTGPGQTGIFVETAHPAKFPYEVEKSTGKKVEIPEALRKLMDLKKNSIKIPGDYPAFQKQIGK